MTDAEFIERVRAILDQPSTDEFKIQQIRALLAEPESTRWHDTGSGAGWSPDDAEHGDQWGRHDDPEAGR
jgi:hypothetical protein